MRINPDDIKITPEDGIRTQITKAFIKLGMRHAQASEARAAKKAQHPRELDGLDLFGVDPAKHGPLKSFRRHSATAGRVSC